ncbi:MAG: sulfur carrier protein ThiS [Pirellulales bacterium]
MTIILNGETRDVAPGTTVAELLGALEVPARHVAVEVNLELVPRTRHAEQVLHENDRLEVVTLVGGG